MFLLATDVLRELRRPRPQPAVLEWMRGLRPTDIALSVVSLADLQHSIEQTRPVDPERAAAGDAWLDDLVRTGQILSADAAVMRLAARLVHRHGEERVGDALVAATALHHGLTLATRRARAVLAYGVLVANPWRGVR